jgi:hypothetical protein
MPIAAKLTGELKIKTNRLNEIGDSVSRSQPPIF